MEFLLINLSHKVTLYLLHGLTLALLIEVKIDLSYTIRLENSIYNVFFNCNYLALSIIGIVNLKHDWFSFYKLHLTVFTLHSRRPFRLWRKRKSCKKNNEMCTRRKRSMKSHLESYQKTNIDRRQKIVCG